MSALRAAMFIQKFNRTSEKKGQTIFALRGHVHLETNAKTVGFKNFPRYAAENIGL